MRHLVTALFLCFGFIIPVLACTPIKQTTNPPRLVNGEWIQDKADKDVFSPYEIINNKLYTYVFSGIYTKQISYSDLKLNFIETKKVWQGNIPKTIELSTSSLPGSYNCEKLVFGKEYIFVGTNGNRRNPINLKYFFTATTEIKNKLGLPSKQWLRGRLIQTRK